MCQHRFTGDITNRVQMIDVGLQLAIHLNETFFIHRHAGRFEAEAFAVGTASDRDQDSVKGLLRRDTFARQLGGNPPLGST